MPESAESPKRPWFQIHLSTAVVLMVVAGILLWATEKIISNQLVAGGNWRGRIIGLAIAAGVLSFAVIFYTAVGCEWLIRKREEMKQTES